MPRALQSLELRFARYLQLGPLPANTALGPCLLWAGKIDRWGYGWFHVKTSKPRRQVQAHRLAWTLFGNELPAGLCVLHKCDVPNCVNVGHLFLGTHFDNVVDKIRKGRMPAQARKHDLPQGVERVGKKFRARTGGGKGRKHVGLFATLKEAGDAAAKARKERYGLSAERE